MPKNKNNGSFFFVYVNEYLENMRIELKSERTIETYRTGLNEFRKYLRSEHGKAVDKATISFVTADLVREYLYWLTHNGSSMNTRNIRLASLKSYISFCASRDMDYALLEVGMTKVKTKAATPKTHNWLDKQQVETLINQPPNTKTGVRDRFILIFLFSTGARLRELLDVRICDITLSGEYPYVYLHGKGNKKRIVPVPEKGFVDNLNYYLSLFHSTQRDDDYLFYTRIKGRQEKMSEDNVQRIVKKYGKLAKEQDSTIPEVHPHLLRHSYGAQLYRLGASLPEIAKLMGHAEIRTTEIYAETDADIIAEAISRTIGKQPARIWDSLSEDEKLKVLGLVNRINSFRQLSALRFCYSAVFLLQPPDHRLLDCLFFCHLTTKLLLLYPILQRLTI